MHKLSFSVTELTALAGPSIAAGRSLGLLLPAQGTRGHRRFYKGADRGCREQVVQATVAYRDIALQLHGKADYLHIDATAQGGVTLQECKCLAHAAASIDPALYQRHVLQLRIYALLAARMHTHKRINASLHYITPRGGLVLEVPFLWSRDELERAFEHVFAPLYPLLLLHIRHRRQVKKHLTSLPFAHPQYRPFQREAAGKVFTHLKNGESVLIEASTGMGKTLATLFGALKLLALPDRFERIAYLTATETARRWPQQQLGRWGTVNLHLRVLRLSARQQLCECCALESQKHQSTACGKASAKVRFKALEQVLAHKHIDAALLRRIAGDHQCCAAWLQSNCARFCDVIIGDYNHAWDPFAHMSILTAADTILLVDEAHNVVSRMRKQYSAALWLSSIAVKKLWGQHSRIQKQVEKFLHVGAQIAGSAQPVVRGPGEEGCRVIISEKHHTQQLRRQVEKMLQIILSYSQRHELTAKQREFFFALYRFYTLVHKAPQASSLVLGVPASTNKSRGSLQQLHVQLLVFDVQEKMAAFVQAGQCACFFSATLYPLDFFRQRFGLPRNTPGYRFGPVFNPQNQLLLVSNHVQFSYHKRDTSVKTVAQSVVRICSDTIGNYLLFAPTYTYAALIKQYVEKTDGLHAFAHPPNPTAEQKELFIRQCQHQRPHTSALGCSVLGGMFSEAMDLIGKSCIGVFILGAGIAPPDYQSRLLQQYYDSIGVSGFAYACIIPAMIRVRQAAGRLIRSEKDRGIVVFYENRLLLGKYRTYLPQWWDLTVAHNNEQLARLACAFSSAESDAPVAKKSTLLS